MATLKITGEQPFQVNAHSFIASPSATEYTFAYSADGKTYTNYTQSTPANENLIVFGIAFGTYCKLVGASGKIEIKY